MQTITTTDALAAYCRAAREHPYVTVDTEFLRERTYYSRLCLVQMAVPGKGDAGAVLVDPVAGGEALSLEPLYELFSDPGVVKVFHAARQDLEIFHVDAGVIPAPLFDTQVAAMVCGFGEQAGYETLVKRIARATVDKSSRFTDWSRRPLTEAQMAYALADVTHLRPIYEFLASKIESTGRAHWVAEEMAVLTSPETYRTDPAEAWRRIKTRNTAPKFLAVLRELARFREEYAQAQDVPRARVLKDDALLELAATRPQTPEDLGRARLLLREARKGPVAEGILAAVKAGLACPPEAMPRLAEAAKPAVNPALADMLRVLLKARADASGVAARLIASAADLDHLAAGGRDVPALSGWRRDLFGADALRLCAGELGLVVRGEAVEAVPL
ncbi:MAG: ribonuclease D [Roseovarius sp.]|nr:ribonuclease D [Roseovarius sp.]